MQICVLQINVLLMQLQGIFPWVMWFIWKSNNKRIFQGTDSELPDTLHLAKSELLAWRKAQSSGSSPEEVHQTLTQQSTGVRCKVDGFWKESGPTSGMG